MQVAEPKKKKAALDRTAPQKDEGTTNWTLHGKIIPQKGKSGHYFVCSNGTFRKISKEVTVFNAMSETEMDDYRPHLLSVD
jgi:hypothetical protein